MWIVLLASAVRTGSACQHMHTKTRTAKRLNDAVIICCEQGSGGRSSLLKQGKDVPVTKF